MWLFYSTSVDLDRGLDRYPSLAWLHLDLLTMHFCFSRLWSAKPRCNQAQGRAQQGFVSVEMTLALLISALVAAMTLAATRQAADATAAGLQADALMAIRGAAHRLVMTNYGAYQAQLPITKNAVTLADGATSGQSRYPTVANLRAMDLGVNNALDFGIYKSLTGAGYDIKVTLSPACAATPGSINCHVTGLVCLTAPIKDQSSAVGEVDGPGQGVMLGRMGGSGGSSLLGNASTLLSADGSWSATNPYGSVAGIMCARFGWGSESDDYLRVSDTRDPNFQGGETVSGTISGSTYTLQANGDAKITGALTVGATGAAATACTPDGGMGWGNVGGVPTLMKCQSGVWTPTNLALAVESGACTPEGRIAQSTTGAFLICQAAIYRPIKDLVGRVGLYAVSTYAQGEVVPTPTCGASLFARNIPFGVVSACSIGAGGCANDTGSFTGQISAIGVVSILGSDGSVAGAGARLVVASVCTTS
jgi:hypothetical protein